MSDMTTDSTAAREAARTERGQFGPQSRACPGDVVDARPDWSAYADGDGLRQDADRMIQARRAATAAREAASFLAARQSARLVLARHPEVTHIELRTVPDPDDHADGYSSDIIAVATDNGTDWTEDDADPWGQTLDDDYLLARNLHEILATRHVLHLGGTPAESPDGEYDLYRVDLRALADAPDDPA